jgi:hypothetical protein
MIFSGTRSRLLPKARIASGWRLGESAWQVVGNTSNWRRRPGRRPMAVLRQVKIASKVQ